MIDNENLSTLTVDELKTYLESIMKYYQDRLDEQMRKLEPETKYKIGDTVGFVIYANEWVPVIDEIAAIHLHEDGNQYYVDGNWWPEHQLYPTKDDLIEAQIAYWTAMREPVECQHESDGRKYSESPMHCDNHKFKCTKCGEFYR